MLMFVLRCVSVGGDKRRGERQRGPGHGEHRADGHLYERKPNHRKGNPPSTKSRTESCRRCRSRLLLSGLFPITTAWFVTYEVVQIVKTSLLSRVEEFNVGDLGQQRQRGWEEGGYDLHHRRHPALVPLRVFGFTGKHATLFVDL